MMAEQMTPDIEAIRARHEAANAEVNALCRHEHKWRMCIPVQPTDSDVVISNSLRDIPALLAHVDAQAAELTALRDVVRELVVGNISWTHYHDGEDICGHCLAVVNADYSVDHEADCPVKRGRDIVTPTDADLRRERDMTHG